MKTERNDEAATSRGSRTRQRNAPQAGAPAVWWTTKVLLHAQRGSRRPGVQVVQGENADGRGVVSDPLEQGRAVRHAFRVDVSVDKGKGVVDKAQVAVVAVDGGQVAQDVRGVGYRHVRVGIEDDPQEVRTGALGSDDECAVHERLLALGKSCAFG